MSLSNFKRNTPEFLRQMKETGRPVVLTINGKAELVVQDSASYQKLVERAGRAEGLDITRKSVTERNAGLGRPAEEMLAEMRRILAEVRGRYARRQEWEVSDMSIHFEIPQDIEQGILNSGLNMNLEAKEAYLVELYRQERISHRQLAEALGLNRYETDGVLKLHKVSPNVTAQEMRAQSMALKDARPE
jgi:predicted HTH domain antitoxin/PHD/YefM family antitoxin component YafN of YafNO toxin-antitoxin module